MVRGTVVVLLLLGFSLTSIGSVSAAHITPDSGVPPAPVIQSIFTPSGSAFTNVSLEINMPYHQLVPTPGQPNIYQIVNGTIYYGTTCGTWTHFVSTGLTLVSGHTYWFANHGGGYFVLTGFTSGVTYCFAASAWNSTGQSSLSATMRFTVPTASPPSSPNSLALPQRGPTYGILTWNNPGGPLTGDIVQASPLIDGYCVSWANVTGGASGVFSIFNYSGLSPAGEYCVAVQAYNFYGTGPLSNIVYIVPTTPFALVVLGQTTSSVAFGWANTPYRTIANVTLHYGTTCGLWKSVSLGNVSVVNVTGLTAGKAYCFTVSDWYTSSNQSAYAASISDTTVGITPTPSPGGGGGLCLPTYCPNNKTATVPAPVCVGLFGLPCSFPWWVVALGVVFVGVVLLMLGRFIEGSALTIVGALLVAFTV
jgi:hypothetical protein